MAHIGAVVVAVSSTTWGLVGAVHLGIAEPLAVTAEVFHLSRREKATGLWWLGCSCRLSGCQIGSRIQPQIQSRFVQARLVTD